MMKVNYTFTQCQSDTCTLRIAYVTFVLLFLVERVEYLVQRFFRYSAACVGYGDGSIIYSLSFSDRLQVHFD